MEALLAIKQKGEQLLDTVSDTLELCELELDQQQVDRTRCELGPIVDEAHRLMLVWAQPRRLRLLVEYVGAVPETIETDPVRLRQILINLLGNAIKFTANGDVRMQVRLAQDDAGEPGMQFDVIDSGIGMSKDQAASAFQGFAHADKVPDPQSRGTGLGLAISKRYAELLGGDIVILNTVPGIGTHVRLTIGVGMLEGVRMVEPCATTTEADSRSADEDAERPEEAVSPVSHSPA